MSATIYMHEFRTRLKSVLVWSLSMAAIIYIFLSLYPGFSSEAALLNQVFAKMPPALLEAFGMTKTDLTSLLGFYSFVFLFVQLCLAIQAGNYGFGLVSIEESELTADFLLSKPVSRFQVLTSKLLAAFTSLTITNLVLWAITYFSVALFKGDHPYSNATLTLLLGTIVIFQLFFLGVGLVISLIVRRVRSVTPYSLGLGFGAYILAAFSGILGEVKLEYITPFKHIDPAYIVRTGSLDTPLVLLNAAVTVVAVVVSYWLYLRRDIHAVS